MKPDICPASVQLLSDLFVYRDLFAVLAQAFKLYFAINEGKQGIVFPFTNISTRMDLRSTLSDKDVSGKDKLSVSPFGSKTL